MKIKINSDILNEIKLVIFDKDGTLIDLYTYWANMIIMRANIAQKKLSFSEIVKEDAIFAMGVDVNKKRLRPEGPVGLKKREIVLKAMVDSLERNGFANTSPLCFQSFKEADALSTKNLAEIIRPIDGMHDLINDLCNHQCKIAIATTDKTERAELAVNILDIANKIELIVGADKVTNCKPHPEMINLILKKTGISKGNAVMIGDAPTDVDMGINAGLAASIGVCSGLSSKEDLLKKTKYVASDISKIIIQ